jgi:hypothetical protein
MWIPAAPIVIAGYTLTREEAWLREFTQAWCRLARRDADEEQIADRAIELLATEGERDPLEVARMEFSKVD